MLSQASEAFTSLAALLLFLRVQLPSTAAAAHANPPYPLQSTPTGTPDRFSAFWGAFCHAWRSYVPAQAFVETCVHMYTRTRITCSSQRGRPRPRDAHVPPAVLTQNVSGQTAEVVVSVCAGVLHQAVLKHHGDAFDGRGLLSAEVDPPCTPSTRDGFACSLSRLTGDVIVHYNPVATGGKPQTRLTSGRMPRLLRAVHAL